MDIFDRATELEMAERERSLQQARAKAHHARITFSHCETCGAEIPLARQKALPGVRICVTCAQDEERLAKRFRRTG